VTRAPVPPPPAPNPRAPLAIVTVAHHSGGVLPALAKDLAQQQQAPSHWIVVDNSPRSSPVEPQLLQPEGGPSLTVHLLQGEEGDGFGAGCNRALSWLDGQGWGGWVWLLNPDTSLPEGNELQQLVDQLATLDPRSLVGTAVEDGSGGLEASGGWFSPGLRFRSERLDPISTNGEQPLCVDWLSGCSLALQPTAHAPSARFDPAFPLYYEDMDLCLRLGRRGAPVLWLPHPRITHRRGQGSGSRSPRRWRLSTVSYLRFLRRHCPRWVGWMRSLRLLVVNILRFPLQPRRSGAVLAGALEAWQDQEPVGGEP
jgi:N-acetylglucosaminyl-diphospho-decaprenol L-rhamnosyltransferase